MLKTKVIPILNTILMKQNQKLNLRCMKTNTHRSVGFRNAQHSENAKQPCCLETVSMMQSHIPVGINLDRHDPNFFLFFTTDFVLKRVAPPPLPPTLKAEHEVATSLQNIILNSTTIFFKLIVKDFKVIQYGSR